MLKPTEMPADNLGETMPGPAAVTPPGLPRLPDLPSLHGRSVLVRTDFNVPARDGRITDDLRIAASVETLTWLLAHGAARLTVATHLGRPGGRKDPRYALTAVAGRLGELLAQAGADPARVVLRENLRWHPGEEANDPSFVTELVAGHDCYVNDAFGAAHRAHASIVGPPRHLPSAAGRTLAREVEVLTGLLETARAPFVAVLGGAKVSDKLGVIESLCRRVDTLVVGGAMCFTFLAAAGHDIGSSLFEPDQVATCARLLASGPRILLPVDLIAASQAGGFSAGVAPSAEVGEFGTDLPAGWAGLDIGPRTAAAFAEVIASARTVFWNGPMGLFEDRRFREGTRAVARAVSTSPAFTVVGGGDSAAALRGFGLARTVGHLSTGGGASLEFLERGDLPGLAALRDHRQAA